MQIDISKAFDYENGFYLASQQQRIGKFAAHLELFRKVSDVAGEIVECGVYKGASLSRFIKFRAVFENPFSKKIIAFDTFGAFPEAHYEPDKAKRDQFIEEGGPNSISKEELADILKKLDLYENIELIEGDVLLTIDEYKKKNKQLKISLLHIDVDLYEATKACLEGLYPMMTKGGIVILDDYNKFAGATKAIDEYFSGRSIRIQKLPYSGAVSFIEIR